MFELPTRRLCLMALDAENLRLDLDDPELLESNLGLHTGHTVLTGDVRDAVKQMLDGVLRDPKYYLWYTHWLIVLNRPKSVAGGLCFKGPPGANGEVEIGYGVNTEYQNRGLMTEALRVICRWALQQQDVSAVLAETERTNLPSQRVLEKAGFVLFRETDTMCWWRLQRGEEPPGGLLPSSYRGMTARTF